MPYAACNHQARQKFDSETEVLRDTNRAEAARAERALADANAQVSAPSPLRHPANSKCKPKGSGRASALVLWILTYGRLEYVRPQLVLALNASNLLGAFARCGTCVHLHISMFP